MGKTVFGLYTILPLPILYGAWRRTHGGSGGGLYVAHVHVSCVSIAIVVAVQMEGAIHND